MTTWPFWIFKNLLNRYRQTFEITFSNKTANTKGKNRPVYNQALGRQSHCSKTANINLTRLHLERYQRVHVEIDGTAIYYGQLFLATVTFAVRYDFWNDFVGKGTTATTQ